MRKLRCWRETRVPIDSTSSITVAMEELAGLILGGGLVFVASSFVAASAKEADVDHVEANVDNAKNAFNDAYSNIANNNKKGDKLILAPAFGESYVVLQASLAKIGVSLSMYSTEQYAQIDLTSFLKGSSSFATERKIQQALIEEGLLMCPGEAFGAAEPGFFRITAPVLTKEQVSAITDKIYNVSKRFNTLLTKRSAPAVVSSEESVTSKVEEDEVSVADSVPESLTGKESSRKKRKN